MWQSIRIKLYPQNSINTSQILLLYIANQYISVCKHTLLLLSVCLTPVTANILYTTVTAIVILVEICSGSLDLCSWWVDVHMMLFLYCSNFSLCLRILLLLLHCLWLWCDLVFQLLLWICNCFHFSGVSWSHLQSRLPPPLLIPMDTRWGVAGLLLCHRNNLYLEGCLLSLKFMTIMPWFLNRRVFLFLIWASYPYFMLVCVMVCAGCDVAASFCHWGLIYSGLHLCNPLEHTHGRHMYHFWWFLAHSGVYWVGDPQLI